MYSNQFLAIKLHQSISSNQFTAINFWQSISINQFPAINLQQSISSSQFLTINLEQSISNNQFQAINFQQSISSNQFLAINFQKSIFSNQFPAIMRQSWVSHETVMRQSTPLLQLQNWFQKFCDVNRGISNGSILPRCGKSRGRQACVRFACRVQTLQLNIWCLDLNSFCCHNFPVFFVMTLLCLQEKTISIVWTELKWKARSINS